MQWTNEPELDQGELLTSDLPTAVGKAGASGSVAIFTIIGLIIFV